MDDDGHSGADANIPACAAVRQLHVTETDPPPDDAVLESGVGTAGCVGVVPPHAAAAAADARSSARTTVNVRWLMTPSIRTPAHLKWTARDVPTNGESGQAIQRSR